MHRGGRGGPAGASYARCADDEVFCRGTGCEHCNHSGHLGRLAVYELLVVTPGLRARIVPGATAEEVHGQAVREGMVPLTKNALSRARRRITSLTEVYRVRLE